IAIDLDTGSRVMLSDTRATELPTHREPQAAVLDLERDRALVVDSARRVVVAVDLVTARHTQLTAPGALGTAPRSMALDRAADRLFICETSDASVVSADIVTGEVTVVTSSQRGDGPLLTAPEDIAIEPGSGRI